MCADERNHRVLLERVARQAMLERGLEPDFPAAALLEIAEFDGRPVEPHELPDLRDLPWASIDNDDSRDLDQVTVCEGLAGGRVRVLVAVADVDSRVGAGSALDGHAAVNTTSVYTPARVFPMLPERLSTDLTSLNEGQDRAALIIEMVVDEEGGVVGSGVRRAIVRNQARLTYRGVGAWLEGEGPMPEAMASIAGLDDQLRVQDGVAARLAAVRERHGALDFETIEARPVFEDGRVRALEAERPNRARALIENFMIAANGVTARFLEDRGFPVLRRVVRSPSRWQRIVDVARELGEALPAEPDSVALEGFLRRRREADPLRFPDLSLTIIKLMGRGEYAVDGPGAAGGHFGLAVQDYSHSTAPNRRYPDLLTERLLKAAIAGAPPPYDLAALALLARHCTLQEDNVNKVERLVQKAAAALLLEDRIGERFEGIVTGASPKGTWVRILRPPLEGRVVQGFKGLNVRRPAGPARRGRDGRWPDRSPRRRSRRPPARARCRPGC
jgi:exoribonuclease-2